MCTQRGEKKEHVVPPKHMIFICTRARQLKEKAIVQCSFNSLLSWLHPELFLKKRRVHVQRTGARAPWVIEWHKSDGEIAEKEEKNGGKKRGVLIPERRIPCLLELNTKEREREQDLDPETELEKINEVIFKKWCLKEVQGQKEIKRSPDEWLRC